VIIKNLNVVVIAILAGFNGYSVSPELFNFFSPV